jgi:hypothetical protein
MKADDLEDPYMVRRTRFANGLLDHLIHAAIAAKPQEARNQNLHKRIMGHKGVADLINKIWPRRSPEAVLRTLLNDKETLAAAATGVLSEEEQQAIVRPPVARASDEPWSLADLVCLEELRRLISGDSVPRYRHLVVDEAQDLTPMQARSLARRCPSGSMTILGDLVQATGPHEYADWQQLAELLAGPEGWNLAELTVGYRVPHEVMEFAAPLASAVAPATTFPTSVRPPTGDDTVTIVSTTSESLLAEAASRAHGLSGTDGVRLRSTAIIVPDDPALLDEARLKVSAAGSEHVQVLAAHQVKGLEFDHVIVVEPQVLAEQDPAGLRQLYVAITRCTQSLTLVHSAPLPAVLAPPVEPQEDNELVPVTADPVTDPSRVQEDLRSMLESQVLADRECHVHEQVRFALVSELFQARLAPSPTSSIADITCTGPSGTVLFEVLGDGGYTYDRMRQAVLRIAEIQHAEDQKADHRFLVLPQEPAELWSPDLLTEAFGISVIWRTSTGWDGQRLPIALGHEHDR